MTVLEISECFPNNFRQITGEFILQHVKALSKHCKVIIVVPLRFIPTKELFSLNPLKLISQIYHWFYNLLTTKSFADENLKVIYFKYISFPRPFFETIDNHIIKLFFYKRLKKILNVNKIDLIYCNWLRPWALLSSQLAKDLCVPFVIDHHEDIPTLKKLFPLSHKNFIKIFDSADKIIVHSTVAINEVKCELKTNYLKSVEVKKVFYGQNFIPEETKKNFNQKFINLICVSHLTEARKNIDCLIRAFDLIKNHENFNFSLKIVGDGKLKNEYEKLAVFLSLEKRIDFLGQKTQKEIERILQFSDIFILPSYPEAFGIVFLEALSKGLPIITCKGNGGGEELKDLGYPVILVNPDSQEELAKSILELSSNKPKMSFMSEHGISLIKNYFTWNKNAETTFNFLKETISDFKLENNVWNQRHPVF